MEFEKNGNEMRTVSPPRSAPALLLLSIPPGKLRIGFRFSVRRFSSTCPLSGQIFVGILLLAVVIKVEDTFKHL